LVEHEKQERNLEHSQDQRMLLENCSFYNFTVRFVRWARKLNGIYMLYSRLGISPWVYSLTANLSQVHETTWISYVVWVCFIFFQSIISLLEFFCLGKVEGPSMVDDWFLLMFVK
jgi:hypothetical protein